MERVNKEQIKARAEEQGLVYINSLDKDVLVFLKDDIIVRVYFDNSFELFYCIPRTAFTLESGRTCPFVEEPNLRKRWRFERLMKSFEEMINCLGYEREEHDVDDYYGD